jgi:hypothetical protein
VDAHGAQALGGPIELWSEPTSRQAAAADEAITRSDDAGLLPATIAWAIDGRRQLEPLPPDMSLVAGPWAGPVRTPATCYWRSTPASVLDL